MFQARQITKTYHRRKVVDRVSFALPAGECLGVVGQNGTGKSTLLRILAQTLRPDSGEVLFQGRPVMADREFLRTHLGYVAQGSDLIPDLTAQQQLDLWRSACGCREPIPGQVVEILGLEELHDVPIGEMSGGMQRRVSIAMALSTCPQILIMDEATTGLDQQYRDRLLDYLELYLRQGGRMVWCSHQEAENRRLCGSLLTMGQETTAATVSIQKLGG